MCSCLTGDRGWTEELSGKDFTVLFTGGAILHHQRPHLCYHQHDHYEHRHHWVKEYEQIIYWSSSYDCMEEKLYGEIIFSEQTFHFLISSLSH